MKRKYFLLPICFLLLISIIACPSMTKKQNELLITKEYTLTLRKYNDWYDKQTTDVQAQWKEKIDPKFKVFGTALDIYTAALQSGENVPASEDKYLAAKAEVFKLLLEAGVIQQTK